MDWAPLDLRRIALQLMKFLPFGGTELDTYRLPARRKSNY